MGLQATISRRDVCILVPSAAIGVALGYLLAARVSDAWIAVLIGTISIGFGTRRLYLETRPPPPKPCNADILPGMFWGICSGFTGMVAHAAEPPFPVYVLPQKLNRDVFVGTTAAVFTIVNWLKVFPYIALGQMTRENMITASVLLPLAFAPTWADVFLIRRIGGRTFYLMVYTMLISIGSKLIFSARRDLGIL